MIEKKEHIYEKAVLVGLITKNQDEDKLTEYLDELEFLAYTAGATVERRFIQKILQPDSKTFVGKGKMEEIRDFVKENEIGTIIFDDELSPSQLKNLEREIEEVKILDRTNLILDIFAQRAQTSYAPPTPYENVDTLRTTTRRNRDAWPRGNGNRDRPPYRPR